MKRDYVLIVETRAATAAALAEAMTFATGFEAAIAADGNEAHACLARLGAPRGLITDLVLPRRDGFSVVRAVRRLDTSCKIPVVTYSAFDAMRRAAAMLEPALQPISILAKPLVPGEVVEALLAAMAVEAEAPPRPAVVVPRPVTASPTMPSMRRAAPETVEAARLDRIATMGVVDEGPPDEELQRITEEVARSFGVPTALVSVVLEGRQWFKSYYGLSGKLREDRGAPRTMAFCHHVVEGREALVVPDARTHPVFADNPLVRDGTVRGYAGAPLVTSHGDVLGSLCIIDTGPLDATAADLERLRLLARRIAGELELAQQRRRAAAAGAGERPEAAARAAALALLHATVVAIPCAAVVFDAGRRVLFMNEELARLFGLGPQEMIGATRDALLARIAHAFADGPALALHLAIPAEGPIAMAEDLLMITPRRRWVRWSAAPLAVPGGAVQLATIDESAGARS